MRERSRDGAGSAAISTSVAVSAALAAAAGLVGFEWHLARANPQVPYMDSLHYIGQLGDFLRGQLSWRDAWYGGEHRGLLFLAVHLTEWLGWGLDTTITTRLAGLVVLATLALWLREWARTDGSPAGKAVANQGRAIAYLVPVAAALLAFSPAGWELWFPNLGLGGALKNFFIIAFLALWAKEVERAPADEGRPWLGFLGAALILLASYGWSYALTLAAVAALVTTRGWTPRAVARRLLLAVPLLAAQAVYVLAGRTVLTRGSSILDAGGVQPLVRGALVGAGSVLVDYETATHYNLGWIALTLLGLGLFCAFAVVLLRMSVDGIDAGRRFQLAVAVFSLGNLGAVAFSRGGSGAEAVAASRYFIDYQWLALGTLALACDRRRLGRPLVPVGRAQALSARLEAVNRGVVPLLIAAIIGGQAITWHHQMRIARYRADHFAKMRNVFLEGVRSESDAQLLQAPLHDAKRGVEIASRFSLGPFRALRASCTLANAKFAGAWYPAGPANEKWMGKDGSLVLSGCGRRVAFDVYLPPTFEARTLAATTDAGRVDVPLRPGQLATVDVDVGADRETALVNLALSNVTPPSSIDERPLGVLVTRIRANPER